ncbi:MAG: hypothetical protein IPL61_38230 [Myxococcales bacterium]|nr:hypothetical protein [Myxococcales bacterium]
MPFPGFELACVAIVALALAALARTRPWRGLLFDYAALAVAGWVGEQTCIAWYDFYRYAPSWHGRLGHVPALIPIIWPLVILSARAVVDAVAPGLGWRRPLVVGALVAFDASLVEVIAVAAGLWGWAEPGHLDVPVLGVLGWGFFAGGADVALRQRPSLRPLALLGALALTHALIVGAWWALFRWTVRGDLGDASVVAVVALGAALVPVAVALRRRGRTLPLDVALPRMIAASLFVVTLVVVAGAATRLWLHTAAVAVPYLALTALPTRR